MVFIELCINQCLDCTTTVKEMGTLCYGNYITYSGQSFQILAGINNIIRAVLHINNNLLDKFSCHSLFKFLPGILAVVKLASGFYVHNLFQ